jgi:hypothetical protein
MDLLILGEPTPPRNPRYRGTDRIGQNYREDLEASRFFDRRPRFRPSSIAGSRHSPHMPMDPTPG